MATITLKRENRFVDQTRAYKIIIDGKQTGTIKNGETKEFTTTPRLHNVRVKIDWCGSNEFYVDLSNGENKILNISTIRFLSLSIFLMPLLAYVLNIILSQYIDSLISMLFSMLLILIPLISLIIWRNSYLKLTEVDER